MNENKQNNAKRNLYILVGILAVAGVVFRLIGGLYFEQTSLLFIGLPALITILVIKYSHKPKSMYGIVFRVITLFLLMSSILLGEGTVCVLFSAPIFYGVSALMVFLHQYLEKREKDKLYTLIIIPIVILMAQPMGIKREAQLQTVSVSQTFSHEISTKNFNRKPNFMDDYPSFFRVGFPVPLDIQGDGLQVGSMRNIRFESTTKGIGTLSLQVVEITDNSIIFDVVKDDTHINHWLTWKKIEVELKPTSNNETEVIWTTEYTCDLGPQWYFEPLEYYTVGVMNNHLIKSYFAQ